MSQEEVIKKMYLEDKMSQKQISLKLGICQQRVSQVMKKLNIDIRSFSESMLIHNNNHEHIKISDIERQIIYGELLGDGCLSLSKTVKNGLPFYRHSNKHKEYLEWLSLQLPSLRWTKIYNTVHKKISKITGKNIESFNKNSKVHPDLKDIYYRFYYYNKDKSRFIKKAPKDLIITPLILRHWYLGDGSISWGKKKPKSNRIQCPKKRAPTIVISCQSHDNNTLNIYIEQMKEMGIIFSLNNYGKTIRLSSEDIPRFFELIGECPIDCYKYKWSFEDKDYNNLRDNYYNYIKNLFVSNNCILLTENIDSFNQKLDYICECGNKSEITFSRFKIGNRCKACSNKKIGDMKRPDYKNVKKDIESKGLILLEKEYKNNSTPMKCICLCGEIVYKTYGNIKKGAIRCKKCAKKQRKDSQDV